MQHNERQAETRAVILAIVIAIASLGIYGIIRGAGPTAKPPMDVTSPYTIPTIAEEVEAVEIAPDVTVTPIDDEPSGGAVPPPEPKPGAGYVNRSGVRSIKTGEPATRLVRKDGR